MASVDLRSDTVTKPTPGMLKAMTEAPVGDDVFRDDPSVNAFEEKVADMFGKEAGLFVPSGVMSNQICLYQLTKPGDEVILDELAHIFNYEAGSAALISGVQLRPLKGNRGMLDANQVEAAIRTTNDWDPHTRVVAVENTTNKGGGAVYPLKVLQEIGDVARRNGLFYHLDGARIWNALAANRYKAKEVGTLFDTISVCFSKGLGAPVGSMMLAEKSVIRDARRTRKMLGGGMRQVGLLAAAADYALEHHFSLLEADFYRAKKLAEVISESGSFRVKSESVESNILLFDTEKPANKVLAELNSAGIWMSAFGPYTIRAVFHHQITDADFSKVCAWFESYEPGPKP
ncbi:MAG: aminotransferase class I/II-fold pyridoxal phosphate-dependent enzyme [Balneolales bacterium]|nr:aminotransferase class I/II-fold pyridoxal phosphate-dependent enzyme [Balneolales bacterium]